jgi:hypothetical protein
VVAGEAEGLIAAPDPGHPVGLVAGLEGAHDGALRAALSAT